MRVHARESTPQTTDHEAALDVSGGEAASLGVLLRLALLEILSQRQHNTLTTLAAPIVSATSTHILCAPPCTAAPSLYLGVTSPCTPALLSLPPSTHPPILCPLLERTG